MNYKSAIYPGSFYPWHEGHTDILEKAFKIFDEITICRMVNPDKDLGNDKTIDCTDLFDKLVLNGPFDTGLQIVGHSGLLIDAVNEYHAHAVIRGLRNSTDFEYEKNLQYNYEDLGLVVPVIYLISDRKLVHVSSSAKRALKKYNKQ